MRVSLLLASSMMVGASAMAENLPVPPMPPAIPPVADAAPVPNLNAEAPVTPTSDKPSVNVQLYRANTYDPSVGFAPGSRFQTTEDRKSIQTPGFSISVPLK